MIVALLVAGCHRYTVPDPVPDPWADDAPLALEPLREVLTTTLADASAPARLVPLADVPSLLVLDPGSGTAHVLDARYRHLGQRHCLSLTDWDHLDDGTDRQGTCAEGEAEIRPGELAPPGGVRVAVSDPEGQRVWLVSGAGALLSATLDLVGDNPLDYLRPVLVAELDGLGEGTSQGLGARASDGTLWVALDGTLTRWDTDGASLEAHVLPGDAVDLALVDDRPWVATTAGLWQDGVEDPSLDAARIVPDDDGAWLSLPGGLRHLPDGVTVDVAGLTGPLARAPRSGRLYAAVSDGVVVIEAGAELARVAPGAPVDLAANGSHELGVLLADGSVAVFVDDTAIHGPAPLGVAVAAFFENPRRSDQAVPCDGDQGFAAYLARAVGNRAWLDDVPAAVLLGVTPEVARTATRCDVEDDLRAVWDGPRIEVGALFHEQPSCGGDVGCVADDLAEEAADLAAAGLAPTWSSGVPTWDLDGEDWVAALSSTAPPRVLFFALSILPEVPQEDPRGKEPFPWLGEVAPTAWRPTSAADPTTDDPDGPIVLYPGNNVPGFMLGQCANLTVRACDRLGQGGGAAFDAQDVEVLDLLLHRALAWRSEAGPDTWSFHLPALENYDYTEGCTATDRAWSGEGCEASLLQGWLREVHQRYVLNGLAAWTLPSELTPP